MFYKKPSLLNRILKAFLLVFLALFLGVLSCIGYQMYQNYLKRPADIIDEPVIEDTDMTFESGVSYTSTVTDSRAVFCSSESINFLNLQGKNEASIQTAISNPQINAKGEYLLVTDKGSKKAYLYKGSKEHASFETEGGIISASVCEKGYSVFVTKGDLHKCSVLVFNDKGEEIFKWNSGGLNVLDADISPSGSEICVSTVNTDGGMIKSNIIMFNTSKDKPFTNDVYEGVIFASVTYESNYVYVIGDSIAYIYNGYGKVLGMIDYTDRDLITFDCEKNNLVLVFSNSAYLKGGSLIENYNPQGEMIGRCELLTDIRYLDVKGSSIAVNLGNSIMILDLKCRERKNVLLGTDISNFMFFGGESTGLGVSGSKVRFIRIK